MSDACLKNKLESALEKNVYQRDGKECTREKMHRKQIFCYESSVSRGASSTSESISSWRVCTAPHSDFLHKTRVKDNE
jgi:hypothetical protein